MHVDTAVVLAVTLLQLREQRMILEHQQTELHDRIKNQQARLWNQQLQIAVFTAPNAIAQTVGNYHLKMVPATNIPGRASWTDQPETPDAE